MTTDLVPYDPDFASGQYQAGYALVAFTRQMTEAGAAFRKFVDQVGAAASRMVRAIVEAFVPMAYRLDPVLLLPDPGGLLCGHVQVHPIDGTKWRVAGRRNNRHWIRSGPRRPRWWK